MKNQKLLDEILDLPDSTRLRQASLDAGLLAMRRKRTRRTIVRCTASATILTLVVIASSYHLQKNSPASREIAGVPPASVEKEQPVSEVEIITADKLAALLPDRPIAFVGPAGKQRVILLDDADHGEHSPD